MTDEIELCGAPGPGLAPDPAITCRRLPGHLERGERHLWVGADAYGNEQRMEWTSTGPSTPPCGIRFPMPQPGCQLDPGHDSALHQWIGEAAEPATDAAGVVARTALVLWNDDQLIAHLFDDEDAARAYAESLGADDVDEEQEGGEYPPAAAGPPPAQRPAAKRPVGRPRKKASGIPSAKKRTPAKRAAAKKTATPAKRGAAKKAAGR